MELLDLTFQECVCVCVGWIIYDMHDTLILTSLHLEREAAIGSSLVLSPCDSLRGDILTPSPSLLRFAIHPFLTLQHLDQSHSRSYGGPRRSHRLAASPRLPRPIVGGARIRRCRAQTRFPSGEAECSRKTASESCGERRFSAARTWLTPRFTRSAFSLDVGQSDPEEHKQSVTRRRDEQHD